MRLADLLDKVNRLFPRRGKRRPMSYDYSLSRFNDGLWNFTLVNNWYRWVDKNYCHQFYGATPESAIESFLNYVKSNKIKVSKLMHEE